MLESVAGRHPVSRNGFGGDQDGKRGQVVDSEMLVVPGHARSIKRHSLGSCREGDPRLLHELEEPAVTDRAPFPAATGEREVSEAAQGLRPSPKFGRQVWAQRQSQEDAREEDAKEAACPHARL